MTLDAIIVGAGPAGTVLAGLLAATGIKVLLVEAARFPRNKPCGECLNPGALRMLERLGLHGSIEELCPMSLGGWRLSAGGRRVELAFPSPFRGAAVDRVRFDAALAEWAVAQGAVLEQGVRVQDLLIRSGRVAGVQVGLSGRSIRLPARVVVGADGLRSVVARRLGLSQPGTSPPKVAFTGHYDGVDGLLDKGELHFSAGGMVGIAPISGRRANVTVVVPAELAPAVRASGFLQQWPSLRERFERAAAVAQPLAVGPFHRPVRAVHAPGALLVGDAAGYFDPATGQGIYRALLSASLAAEAIGTMLAGDPRAAARYQDALARAVRPGYRLQRALDHILRRPRLLDAGLSLLSLLPSLGSWLMGQVGDCYPLLGAPEVFAPSQLPGARPQRGASVQSWSKE